jgi:hypothetical protein
MSFGVSIHWKYGPTWRVWNDACIISNICSILRFQWISDPQVGMFEMVRRNLTCMYSMDTMVL